MGYRNHKRDQTGLHLRPTRKKIEFLQKHLLIDAVFRRQTAATNPTVLRKTFESGGANLTKGCSNLLDDIAADGPCPERTPKAILKSD